MLLWISLLTLPFIWSAAGGTVCSESSYGTDFIFGLVDLPYYKSGNAEDPTISLHVSSKSFTYIYMSLPSTASASKTTDYITTKYRLYSTSVYNLNSTFINKNSDPNFRSSIRIHARDPISVVVEYSIGSHFATNPILPVSALSTSYVVPSYPRNQISHSKAQLLVVALNDSTTIHIKHYDISVTHTIDANKTFIYETSSNDISGASIISNYPVAVFSSVNEGDGSRYYSYDLKTYDLFMQVPPIRNGALHFIVPPLPSTIKNYRVRIYASHGGAHVDIHTSSENVKHMHVYENIFYEYSSKGSNTLEIVSDNPIMVVQIASNSNGNTLFMTNIPAVSQYMTSYLTDNSHTYYIITVRYEEALGLLVDRQPLLHNPEAVAHRTPMGNYTTFTIKASSHNVVSHVNNEPFGLFVYYNDNNNGIFAYSAGMNFEKDCVQTTSSGQIIG